MLYFFQIDEMKIHVRFDGHKDFVYSLSWSHDDRFLMSVSSDQTARFWDVKEQIIEHVQVTLISITYLSLHTDKKKF